MFAANMIRFSLFSAIFGLNCLVLPCLGQPKCEPLDIPFCNGLPYNTTVFPNTIGHDTQMEAELDVNQYSPLAIVGCSRDLVLFVCSVYAPNCVLDKPILPCRSLCNSVRNGCEELMKLFGFGWPANFSCDRFPSTGEECIGESTQPSRKSGELYPNDN